MPDPADITVDIYGNRYTLRSEGSAADIRALATQVDARMREAARGSGPLSVDRLAVLAALNLADDLARALGGGAAAEAAARRLEHLIVMLDDEVGKSGVHGV